MWAKSVPQGEAPHYEPVRYGDYLMARIDANYDYRRELD